MAHDSEGGVFYLVWNKAASLPVYEHATGAAAEVEATRLANAHPGVKFYVLKATLYVETQGLKRVQLQPQQGERRAL